MQEQDFPALYRSANELSQNSQKHFLSALRIHLVLLVVAAALSIVNIPHWSVAALQLGVLLGALGCSVFLFSKRPDRHWYAGRAVAESIKTITWRYVCRAEPFQGDEAAAKTFFQQKLRAIVAQNREVAQTLTSFLDAPQLTDGMRQLRALPLTQRKANYATGRVIDQLGWYAKKAAFNRKTSNAFFWLLIATNTAAAMFAILRMRYVEVTVWPTDVLVAAAASLLSWMQAKRYSELASSYALTAHEIGLIREQSLEPATEEEFSHFVGDAENAFSREHTQWVARKDA